MDVNANGRTITVEFTFRNEPYRISAVMNFIKRMYAELKSVRASVEEPRVSDHLADKNLYYADFYNHQTRDSSKMLVTHTLYFTGIKNMSDEASITTPIINAYGKHVEANFNIPLFNVTVQGHSEAIEFPDGTRVDDLPRFGVREYIWSINDMLILYKDDAKQIPMRNIINGEIPFTRNPYRLTNLITMAYPSAKAYWFSHQAGVAADKVFVNVYNYWYDDTGFPMTYNQIVESGYALCKHPEVEMNSIFSHMYLKKRN